MSLIILRRPPPAVVQNPLSKSWQYTPLPDNATVDTANSPAFVNELVRQSGIAKTYLNVRKFTAEHIAVDQSTPRVPVTCTATTDSHLVQMFAAGVPIPAGTQPTNDGSGGDYALTIYQAGGSLNGEYWEMQHSNLGTNGWTCGFGGHMAEADTRTAGRFITWTTGPAGTYESANWGTQGSAIPYWPGVMTPADIQRGYCNHPLLLEVIDCQKGYHPWPASRSDGGIPKYLSDGSLNPNPMWNVWEGARVRLPAGYPVPSNLHPICQCAIRTDSMFGSFITDKTASSLARRATPSSAPYVGSTAGYDVFNGYPYHDLQLLVAGSDTTPVPTS